MGSEWPNPKVAKAAIDRLQQEVAHALAQGAAWEAWAEDLVGFIDVVEVVTPLALPHSEPDTGDEALDDALQTLLTAASSPRPSTSGLLEVAKAAVRQFRTASDYGRSIQAGAFATHPEERFRAMHEAVHATCEAVSRLTPEERASLETSE